MAEATDPVAVEVFPLEDHSAGSKTAPGLIQVPLGHDFAYSFCEYHGWPVRGDEFPEKERGVIKDRVEVSYDGGIKWQLLCSGWARGDEPESSKFPPGTPLGTGCGSTIFQPDNPDRWLRVSLVTSEPLRTKHTVTTSKIGAKFFPHEEPHSVAYDSSSGIQVVTNKTTFTFTHTSTGGTDNLATLHTQWEYNAFAPIDTLSATFGGSAMTQAVTVSVANGDSTFGASQIDRLVNAATGAQQVVLTWSAASNNGSCATRYWTGASQSAPIGNTATSTGNDNTPTVNCAIGAGNAGADACYVIQNNSGFTGTLTDPISDWGVGGYIYGGGTQYTTGSGTIAFAWNLAVAKIWCICAAEIVAAGGGGGAVARKLPLLGVGT